MVFEIKIMKYIKNELLNKSNQYRYYKSEYLKVKEDLLSAQKGIEELENNLLKEKDNKRKLLKKIEEIKLENQHKKGNSPNKELKRNSLNTKHKKLVDIRTSHTHNTLENVSIGEYTYGNPKIKCYNPKDKLIIGKFCSIAEDVTILIGMDYTIDCASSYPFGPFLGVKCPKVDEIPEKFRLPQTTIIGNDVWIGYGALILSGVKIGDGAVIGARTVVSKDVEPYSIVVGSPLKHIRYRFPKDIRDILVEKKWWDLPDEKIEELAPYLLDPNIHNLIENL